MSVPSYCPNAWVGEICTASGASFELICPPPTRDIQLARNAILTDLARAKSEVDTLTADHAFPAISRIQERLHGGAKARNVLQYGNPCERPDVSIIVALKDSPYWLEQQLAQFATDPEFQRTDLIYLVDSPELADTLRNYRCVIFVDASSCDDPLTQAGTIRVEEILGGASEPARFSHVLSPKKVLDLAAQLYGASPRTFVVTVAGESFTHGDSLSPVVARAVPELIARITELVQRSPLNS